LRLLRAAGAGRAWLVWAALVPIAIWVPLRLFGLERGYPLIPLLAYTPYVLIAAFFVAGVAVAVRNWAAAVVGALATVLLATAVLPRALGARRSTRPVASISSSSPRISITAPPTRRR
jgi:hypothetical protein